MKDQTSGSRCGRGKETNTTGFSMKRTTRTIVKLLPATTVRIGRSVGGIRQLLAGTVDAEVAALVVCLRTLRRRSRDIALPRGCSGRQRNRQLVIPVFRKRRIGGVAQRGRRQRIVVVVGVEALFRLRNVYQQFLRIPRRAR